MYPYLVFTLKRERIQYAPYLKVCVKRISVNARLLDQDKGVLQTRINCQILIQRNSFSQVRGNNSLENLRCFLVHRLKAGLILTFTSFGTLFAIPRKRENSMIYETRFTTHMTMKINNNKINNNNLIHHSWLRYNKC